MRKTIIYAVLFFIATVAFANPPQNHANPIPLVVRPIKPTGGHSSLPKSPIEIPEVWQNCHTLTFDAAIEGCTVQLLDEDENVVFTDSIAENQTSLNLPSYLSGTYELQIITDEYIFYCEIEL